MLVLLLQLPVCCYYRYYHYCFLLHLLLFFLLLRLSLLQLLLLQLLLLQRDYVPAAVTQPKFTRCRIPPSPPLLLPLPPQEWDFRNYPFVALQDLAPDRRILRSLRTRSGRRQEDRFNTCFGSFVIPFSVFFFFFFFSFCLRLGWQEGHVEREEAWRG